MGCKGVVWQWMRMSELEKKEYFRNSGLYL